MNNRCKFDGTPFDANGVCPQCGNTLAAQQSEKLAPTVCPRCGTSFNEYGVCPKCGLKQRTGAGARVSAVMYSGAMVGLKSYLKGFFSRNPLLAAGNAGRSAGKDWHFLAPFTGLISLLSTWGILIRNSGAKQYNVAQALVGMLTFEKNPSVLLNYNPGVTEQIKALYKNLLPKGGLLLLAALGVAALFYAATSGTLYLWHKLQHKDITITQACNLRAAAALPFALSTVLGFGLSFVSLLLSAAVILGGVIMSVVSLYFGSQKASSFQSSPFWAFTGLLAADGLALWLCPMLLFWIFF